MIPAWCLLAETASSTTTRFARLQAMSEWWHWLVLIVVCAAILGYVIIVYWRDSVELSRGVSWSLVLLRLLAFGGILFFFLNLEKRTEQREIKPSRTAVLIDTSQSMALKDVDASAGPSTAPSRIEQVVAELRRGELLKQLRTRHDVAVLQFGDESEPTQVAFFNRFATQTASGDATKRIVQQKQQALQSARNTMIAAASLAGLALLAFIFYLLFGRGHRRGETSSLAILVALVSLVAAFVVFAVANLRAEGIALRAIAGLEQPDFEAEVAAELARKSTTRGHAPPAAENTNASKREERDATNNHSVEPGDVAWQKELIPRGTKTRIGDAVRAVVKKERGGSIAGIVVMTDGGNNAGVDGSVAAKAAAIAGIPIYAVGLGSDQTPVNARVVDLEAPKRVFPGDNFSLTGYVQAHGLDGRRVRVELLSAPDDEKGQTNNDPLQDAKFEEEKTIRLGNDGDVVTVHFEVTPNEVGTWQYFLKVVPPDKDIEPRDNVKSARVKIIQRKTRVLLLAGGPMREYRFLRNQLYRDSDTTVDVLLQSASTGMSQEADDVLFDFPELADELFQYDCIVAFDFDWLQLDELQIELLDRFVAQQAGGLIVIAGPVYTPEWAGMRRGRDPRVDTIKALYPVVFYSQGVPSLGLGRFGGDSAWPLDFTRDGLGAEFLWLEDDPIDSEAAWQSFEGVFGYYAVKDPKPGARVYAHFANPETSIDGELPIYAAAHFYGAGRVFFQASGEMWRLRAVDPRYFETYYTKLIRWASQGRLLRDSSLGVLLVDKDRCLLGDQVTIRAVLSDLQHRPLQLESVPAILLQPDGQRVPIVLRNVQDAAREGMYEAQFTALMAGDYRIELTPSEEADDELLTAEVRVRVPTLEIEHPQRNDALLLEMTKQTGGEYFVGIDAAMNRGGANRATLAAVIEPNDQVIYLPESVDNQFTEQLMGWLIALIVGVLCLEWLLRRLSKLA